MIRVRVLLLVTDLERGGTPLRLSRTARELRRRGIDVTVGCLAPPGPVSRELEADGVPTFACNARTQWNLSAIVRLARRVAEFQPDLVHATLTHANVAARIVGWLLHVPVIGSTATIEVERWVHRLLERRTAFLDEAHVVNAEAVRRHVQSCYDLAPDRVLVVPPLIRPIGAAIGRESVRRSLGLSPDDFVVVWVGRFDPAKRVDVIARSAAAPGCESVRVLLVGDGPLRGEIDALVRKLGLDDRVRLPGWRDDVAHFLWAADVFILPSLTEGMPNAALEALSAGVPVIGSDIPALRELAAGGAPVRLLNPCGPAELAAAIGALHADPPERARIGAASAEWARNSLSVAASVDALLAVYQTVLRARGA